MASINVEKRQTGVVLAADVRDPLGRLLTAAGTVLTQRLYQILIKWGVKTVEIQGDEDETQEQLSAEILEKAQWLVTGRFRHADLSHPFVEELYHQVLKRTERKLAVEEKRGN